MIIQFFQPPAAARTGGLDAAITSLSDALIGHGADLRIDGPLVSGAVVHLHGLWNWAHSRIAAQCRRAGQPHLISPHGMLEPWAWRHKWWKKWPYFWLRERWFLSGANALLATSDMEARRLRQFLPRQTIVTLPLGLTSNAKPDYEAARRQLGWADDETVLLFLSRIHVKKGLDLLLQALTEIPQTGQPLRLAIVGSGETSYVEGLQCFCRTHAAQLPQIDWIGPVWGEERWKFFQGADLFCLPSHSENFGLAVLEALQVGTPVLTTTGTPWADDLQEQGYVAEPNVASVRAAVSRFLAAGKVSPPARQALATVTWNRFDWATLAPRYLELYASL